MPRPKVKLTPTSPMPFGKHKGTPLNEVPVEYVEWLMDQDEFEEKNPEMCRIWLDHVLEKTSNDKFQERVDSQRVEQKAADEIFSRRGPAFTQWFNHNYSRLKGDIHYLPYLRVASEAWNACERNRKPKDEEVPF